MRKHFGIWSIVLVIVILGREQLYGYSYTNENPELFKSSEKTITSTKLINDKTFDSTFLFDGENSGIELRCNGIEDSISFSAWIKPTNLLKKNQVIIGIPDVFWLRTTTSRELQFTQPGVVDNNTSGLSLSNNQWIFIALTIKNSNVSLFMNGKQAANFQWINNKKLAGKTILIGKNNWQENFNGSIAQIRIFRNVFTENEVSESYRSTSKNISLEEGLLLFHSFNHKSAYNASFSKQVNTKDIKIRRDRTRGNVAEFNGKSSLIDFGKIPIDNEITISVWVKPEELSRDLGAVVSLGQAYALRTADEGRLLFTIPQLFDFYSPKNTLNKNEWKQITVTFKEKKQITFYANGKEIASSNYIENQNAEKELKIGNNLWNDFFKGQLDNLLIWNRVLSEEEIQQVYRAESAYWEKLMQRESLNYGLFGLLISLVSVLFALTWFVFRKRKKTIPIQEAQKTNPFLEKVEKIVSEHLTNSDFSVDLFARKMLVSKTKLYNDLKLHTGKSTKEYIRDRRMEKAAELLKTSELSISEIAYETGFESRAYFNKCFKERFGTTPTEFKNAHQKLYDSAH